MYVKPFSEEMLHMQVCQYIRQKYPHVIFSSDPSGMYVSMNQAKKLKVLRSHSGLPDLWILEPRGGWHGLILELKKEGTELYKKNGTLRKNDHLEQQQRVLDMLKEKGYYATFSVGYDATISLIDKYLD